MASVLLCEDTKLDRLVAVKRLHADSPEDVERRFAREAKLGASLNHPNLVSVFDTATDEEGVLIVMEYVEGEALSRALRRGPLVPERVAAMVRDVGAALDHAHAQGVIHRDVKPGNVLLRDDGVTKLVDLGIATAADQTRITRSGMVLGTAAYMAPEQIEGGEPGPATDIYALAVVAYEALTGERARPGRTPMEIAHQIATRPPPDLREVLPGASATAAHALQRGMARDPRARQGSAGELAAELAGTLEEPPTAPTRRVAPVAGADAGWTRGERTAPGEPIHRTGPGEPIHRTAPGAPIHRTGPGERIHRTGRRRPVDRAGRRRPVAAIALALVFLALAAATVIGAVLSAGDDGDGGEAQRADRGGQQATRDGKQAKKEKPKASQEQPAPAPAPEGEPQEEPAEEQPASSDSSRGAQLNEDGFELMQQGDYEAAIPVLQRAVDSFPPGTDDVNYAYALFNLGKSLRLAGRAEEAIPILERRLEIPNQTETVRAELEAARREAGRG
jgi:hypothetical protein